MKIGILAFQGGVIEHINVTKKATQILSINCKVIPVKYKGQFSDLDGLIIPGGESTVLHKLCEREGIFDEIKKVKNIFGTCAGAIMLAKNVNQGLPDQKTLELMDIELARNAYGPQTESFEQDVETKLGKFHAIFIRAPKITKIGKNIEVLAKNNKEIIACEEIGDRYYLATSFHPELTTTKFHERFLLKCKD
ncbi:MAG: pyridoxal 5'-phosphate synthase glutaminase subunit PdxT [Candidatus Micrarchaeota archaeon]|nr:pyridoxal 5'-phosphate synthase glutaminase subunit PdxT [Candidatus Micrarchaeota archaeon]